MTTENLFTVEIFYQPVTPVTYVDLTIVINLDKKQQQKERTRLRNLELKRECFSHYSDDEEIKCVSCGFNRLEVLTLEHPNDDGRKHRSELCGSPTDGKHPPRGGAPFYAALRRLEYPKDYDMCILCPNCQALKNHFGGRDNIQRRKNENLQ